MIQDETVVRWSLKHGADPNLSGTRGSAPLMTAACVGTLAELKLLVASGPRWRLSALEHSSQYCRG